MTKDHGLLTATPGETVIIEATFSDAKHQATADDDGILRNDDGEAFNDGPYRIENGDDDD